MGRTPKRQTVSGVVVNVGLTILSIGAALTAAVILLCGGGWNAAMLWGGLVAVAGESAVLAVCYIDAFSQQPTEAADWMIGNTIFVVLLAISGAIVMWALAGWLSAVVTGGAVLVVGTLTGLFGRRRIQRTIARIKEAKRPKIIPL